jgi:hypothetical protein
MKRSSQVALLLMGAAGIGVSAYALSPSERDCVPPGTPPAAAATASKDSKIEPCPPRRSYTNNGYTRSYWRTSNGSHWWLFSRSPRTTTTTSTGSPTSLGFARPGSTTPARTTTTSRFGFGTIGRAFSISS